MDVIYKLTSPSGKVYIGRTKNFEKRMGEHKNTSESNRGDCKIHQAIRKYGWDNFQKEILCEVSHKQAPIVEEQFIKAYDSYKTGYNSIETGAGGEFPYTGRRDTIEYQEYLKKMSDSTSGENNGMYGKSHSEEAKQKQREKAKGRFSLEWFIDRNGKEEGTRLYEERRTWLKNRNLKKDSKGRFIKGS
jgi:group I intron endonuclease